MQSFLGDLRLALRSFARAPGFAIIAVVTLALGIGANTAIFSVVDSVVLRPLPYPGGDRLVLVQHMRSDGKSGSISRPNFDEWRKQARSFSQLAAFRREAVALTGAEPPRSLTSEVVSANFFETLGVTPRLGRGFAPGEDTEGRNRVAVLTDGGWKRAFGGDPAILGRTISIDHTPVTVVGILPESFRLVMQDGVIDLFLPLPRAFDVAMVDQRDGHYLAAVGRLAPGATAEQASAELQAMAVAYPESNQDRAARAWPLKQKLTATVRPALLVLVGAVGFVLLIACANVANLLLARASVRQHELAVRLALGATRGRVVRQLLTESVVLAVLGAAAGLFIALWSLDALKSVIPSDIARYRELGIDARVLGFTFGVALLTGVVFGLVPALQLSGHTPWTVLKDAGGRTTVQPSRRRARNAFVVAEVAVATVLLVGAALMLRSLQRLGEVDPGFRPDDVLTASISLPDARYADEKAWERFYRDLLPRLEALPGVEGVALGLPIPYTGTTLGLSYSIPGEPPGQNLGAALHLVNPGWFRALGIALRAGRMFEAADDAPGAERVAMVSENLARRHFGSVEAAVGKRIQIGWGDGAELRIVGVAADVREKTLEKEPDVATYVPFSQASFSYLSIGLRSRSPAGLAQALAAAVAAVDPALPVSNVSTMLEGMSDSLRARRMNTLLLATFGGLALLLALIGAYGVMSYSVTQRSGEIAIRMALGARPGDVVRMVVGQGAVLAVVGVAIGLAAALGLSRLLASLLWGVSSTDPVTYVAMAVLFIVVVAAASWVPARRAARVDPMSALRAE